MHQVTKEVDGYIKSSLPVAIIIVIIISRH
jgi:hypothetical protein